MRACPHLFNIRRPEAKVTKKKPHISINFDSSPARPQSGELSKQVDLVEFRVQG